MTPTKKYILFTFFLIIRIKRHFCATKNSTKSGFCLSVILRAIIWRKKANGQKWPKKYTVQKWIWIYYSKKYIFTHFLTFSVHRHFCANQNSTKSGFSWVRSFGRKKQMDENGPKNTLCIVEDANYLTTSCSLLKSTCF
jgi:hypothetical protein